MSRSRTLRPGFFRNEDLCRQPPLNRILFEGLWCESDREGRLRDSPAFIKAMALPYDDCNVDQMLDELAVSGFIRRYEAKGRRFIQVVKFLKHQRPHPKEPKSEIPPPQKDSLCEKPWPDHGHITAEPRPDHGSTRLRSSGSSVRDQEHLILQETKITAGGAGAPTNPPELEVTIGGPPAGQGMTPVGQKRKTEEQVKPEEQPPNRLASVRMAQILADGAKMENLQGPGENKRRMREKDRAKRNHSRPKRSMAEMAWEVVEQCLAESDPSKWTADDDVKAAVARAGGWEYLQLLDAAEARGKFLEAYRVQTSAEAGATR